MDSLRVKFTLALLFTSLVSLCVAGLVARSILFRQFNQVVMDESFRRFQSEMATYIKTYGTLKKQTEPSRSAILKCAAAHFSAARPKQDCARRKALPRSRHRFPRTFQARSKRNASARRFALPLPTPTVLFSWAATSTKRATKRPPPYLRRANRLS